jgi:hypothetical protein
LKGEGFRIRLASRDGVDGSGLGRRRELWLIKANLAARVFPKAHGKKKTGTAAMPGQPTFRIAGRRERNWP